MKPLSSENEDLFINYVYYKLKQPAAKMRQAVELSGRLDEMEGMKSGYFRVTCSI